MKNIFVCPLVVILAGCFGKEPAKTGFEGKPLPSFKLFLTDSITYFDTQNIPNDKSIVLCYFGPNCPYSKSQMEEIIKNINSLDKIRFYVFTTWPYRQMKQFYKDYQLQKYSNVVAGVDYTNFFGNYYGAQGVPYTAIYGKDKRLRQAFIGKVSWKQIKSVSSE